MDQDVWIGKIFSWTRCQNEIYRRIEEILLVRDVILKWYDKRHEQFVTELQISYNITQLYYLFQEKKVQINIKPQKYNLKQSRVYMLYILWELSKYSIKHYYIFKLILLKKYKIAQSKIFQYIQFFTHLLTYIFLLLNCTNQNNSDLEGEILMYVMNIKQHFFVFKRTIKLNNLNILIFILQYLVKKKQHMRASIFTLFIIAIAIFTAVTKQDELYKFVRVSQQRGAACLDGTAPGFYIHEGSGQNKNNYLMSFRGGDFCGAQTLQKTIQSCYNRSFTQLGSTLNVNPTLNSNGLGWLSTLSSQNPYFYDWTKLIINYCDGHAFIGHRDNPIQYKQKKLYFRGSRNAKQIFLYMSQKYDFYNGGKIIISGCSAGGLASLQWADYLYANTKKAQILTIPDSGFFITDFYSQIVNKKFLREYAQPLLSIVYQPKQTPQPILKCLQDPSLDIVDCVNAGNFAQYIRAPILMLQSPYDVWCLKFIVAASCFINTQPYSLQNCNDTTRNAIQNYRNQSIQYLNKIRTGRKDVGVWGPACVQHCFASKAAFNSQNYVVKGITLMQAIKRFVDQPMDAPWLLDDSEWPNNVGCNGIKAWSNLRVMNGMTDGFMKFQ